MARGPVWALVAIRSSAGKRRLAGVLDDGQRRELVMAMAEDVLAALGRSSGLAGFALTTADPDLAALGRKMGARILHEEGEGGLNSALEHARDRLIADGAACLLILHGDVPAVTPADIEALLAAQDGPVTIARAESDGGTNGLLLSPANAIPLHFGPNSCDAHRAAAARNGFSAKVLAIAGLSRDIDQPEDLAHLAAGPAMGKAAGIARALLGDKEKRIGN